MKCPKCGLPMSLADDASVPDNPVWYCDGPNSETKLEGCGETRPVTLKEIVIPGNSMTIELGAPDPERPGAYLGGRVILGLDPDRGDLRGIDADYGIAVDALESLILAHACAGIDVTTPAYVEGIETAMQACADNLL